MEQTKLAVLENTHRQFEMDVDEEDLLLATADGSFNLIEWITSDTKTNTNDNRTQNISKGSNSTIKTDIESDSGVESTISDQRQQFHSSPLCSPIANGGKTFTPPSNNVTENQTNNANTAHIGIDGHLVIPQQNVHSPISQKYKSSISTAVDSTHNEDYCIEFNYIESDFPAISVQQSNGELAYFSVIIEAETSKLFESDNSISSKPIKTNDFTKENSTSSETETLHDIQENCDDTAQCEVQLSYKAKLVNENGIDNTPQAVVIPIVSKEANAINSTSSVEYFGQHVPLENQTTANALPADYKMYKGQPDKNKHNSSVPYLLSPSKSKKPILTRTATGNQMEEDDRDKSSKQIRLEDSIEPTKEIKILMAPSKNKNKSNNDLFIPEQADDTVDDSKILGTNEKDLCTNNSYILSDGKEKQSIKVAGVGIDNASNTTSFAECLTSKNRRCQIQSFGNHDGVKRVKGSVPTDHRFEDGMHGKFKIPTYKNYSKLHKPKPKSKAPAFKANIRNNVPDGYPSKRAHVQSNATKDKLNKNCITPPEYGTYTDDKGEPSPPSFSSGSVILQTKSRQTKKSCLGEKPADPISNKIFTYEEVNIRHDMSGEKSKASLLKRQKCKYKYNPRSQNCEIYNSTTQTTPKISSAEVLEERFSTPLQPNEMEGNLLTCIEACIPALTANVVDQENMQGGDKKCGGVDKFPEQKATFAKGEEVNKTSKQSLKYHQMLSHKEENAKEKIKQFSQRLKALRECYENKQAMGNGNAANKKCLETKRMQPEYNPNSIANSNSKHFPMPKTKLADTNSGHSQDQTSKSTPFECKKCGRRYQYENFLKVHIKRC